MSNRQIAHPDVKVQLTGQNGNAFVIIGAVSKALKRAGKPDEAAKFSAAAMQSESYDALLQLAMKTVDVS